MFANFLTDSLPTLLFLCKKISSNLRLYNFINNINLNNRAGLNFYITCDCYGRWSLFLFGTRWKWWSNWKRQDPVILNIYCLLWNLNNILRYMYIRYWFFVKIFYFLLKKYIIGIFIYLTFYQVSDSRLFQRICW